MQAAKTMNVGGREFPIIGMVKDQDGNATIPLLEIKQMSDERWNQLADSGDRREQKAHDFKSQISTIR